MSTISKILDTIRGYAPDANLTPVMSAYLLAARSHAGQTRLSGDPYLSHPLAVAQLLAELHVDIDTIATALLHDALEDSPITKDQMAAEIGAEIAELVDGVTKVGKLRFRSREDLAAENFRKMMLATSRDVRVILVKLADRLHNIRTLDHQRPAKQVSIARETMDIFVPIANRLGLVRFKNELEDRCFAILEPEASAEIAAYLAATQASRRQAIDQVVDDLAQVLDSSQLPTPQQDPCRVIPHIKNRYDLFKKMQALNLTIQQVPDLVSFQVLAPNVLSCYVVLGLLHSAFPPIPERFRDYVARAKTNGYRALHTTVLGLGQRRIDLQILTPDMARVAREGVVASWRMERGKLALTQNEVGPMSRIREVFESADETENAADFMEALKLELYSDELVVFTPAGDVKSFAVGATALDFAFSIHTDVGLHCAGAKVNGHMVPLHQRLRSGDTVEIVTSASQHPTFDWLSWVRTGRSIHKIRRFLREKERERGIELGKSILTAELCRLSSGLDEVCDTLGFQDSVSQLGFASPEDLYVSIAMGHTRVKRVIRALIPKGEPSTREASTGLGSLFTRWRQRPETPVTISGQEGSLLQRAPCCQPLPGDGIVGVIARGKGIIVHRKSCKSFAELTKAKAIAMEWDSSAAVHRADLLIVCTNRPGVLANMSKVCEQANTNINRVEARPIGHDKSLCTFELAVHDAEQATQLIAQLRQVEGVESVRRAVDNH